MPKLSVISGAYNSASHPYFKESVESVLEQSLTDLEFIICDDGSTDSTLDRLLEYQKLDARIKILRNEKNIGLAAALNRCIEASVGEYIARHDLDDLSAQIRFERQTSYLDSHKEISILGTGAWIFDESGIFGREILPRRVENRDFLFTSPYKHGTVIFRRDALLRSGGYSEDRRVTRNEDYELFMRMQTYCKGENLPEPLYFFCEDQATIRRRKYRYRINEAGVRLRGFKGLGLMPMALPYVIKPLVVGITPSPILKKFRERRREKCNSKQ